ncbi:PEP-utilizing protein [Phaeobacter sp. B1627]|nr:PEP/pyruvate-binding domain-containing protein [Phaeobacter sp. B1627]TNJ45937.1 PEP-utilizing protein [Phaeobacter sp. B1627]
MSQIIALGLTLLSGVGAAVFGRLGWFSGQNTRRRYPVRLITGLIVLAVGLGAANYWQWQTHKKQELLRLQATLTRPAQFDGTLARDPELKETSYAAQGTHPLAITTEDAAELLASGTVRFFDIRETGEHEMGTLPGAGHIRFPDFRQSPPVQPGEQVVLFCHNGNRSSETCAELAKLGVDCRFIAGGIEKWIVETRPFSDSRVQSLSDLRAIPEFENKNKLISTAEFIDFRNAGALQIVDTRYPGDFAAGHLPGAVNIPIRAMTSPELASHIAGLRRVPTLAACYDRRSCFMSQVLGLELTRAGIPFEGRYTVPWEYFVPPPPKPHVTAWLADQNTTLWDKAVHRLGDLLLWGHERSHLLISLLVMALVSRLIVLPITLKSERDQIALRVHKEELRRLKVMLASDPIRKSRAMRAFYASHGLTPLRNLTALLFLPLMMVGLSAAEIASQGIDDAILWIPDLGAPDPAFIAPSLTCALGGAYLVSAFAKSWRSAILWLGFGLPALFGLTVGLSAAGNFYLWLSLAGLLAQHFYVSGKLTGVLPRISDMFRLPKGVFDLGNTASLGSAGNKALRLSQLAKAGVPVPGGVVLTQRFLGDFEQANHAQRSRLAMSVWRQVGPEPCAVRSSASQEDGAEQSFAGVFESVLDVKTETFQSAIEAVLASFKSSRVSSYGGDKDGHGNILVQRMIDATYAGVLFTQDPQAPGMMLLEWVEGNGEELVSGRKTPGTTRFGRFTHDPATDAAPLPFDVDALLTLGAQIEGLFGCPQDVEWAWADGQFHILQSRDITTMSVGSAENQARSLEWRRFFQSVAGDVDPEEILLEQDEMSEVLPRATPLSFSLMSQIWAPGGSLDLACRALRLPYTLPELPNAHLVRLFGKTYVNTKLKRQLTVDLSGNRSVRLQKQIRPTLQRFEHDILPKLYGSVDDWRATRFEVLPLPRLLDVIGRMRTCFVSDIYVEAEKINVLTALAMTEATRASQGDPALRNCLMKTKLEYSPSSLLARCQGSEEDARSHALELMGHRSMFDYELSTPRYAEAPSLLFSLLETELNPLNSSEIPEIPEGTPQGLRDKIELAIACQDLKERAKHESMRVLAELRRALQAFGAKTHLDDLVFHLTIDEVLQAKQTDIDGLRNLARSRRDHDALCRANAPMQPQLSLRECEQLSTGASHSRVAGSLKGSLTGTCVAGSGQATGQVFRVSDETAYGDAAFDGFSPGDILVCHMVNPAWLPQVQQAGAVVSSVGGWLSHMAIIAREKNILMVVGSSGAPKLNTGQFVTVSDDGSVKQERQPEHALRA